MEISNRAHKPQEATKMMKSQMASPPVPMAFVLLLLLLPLFFLLKNKLQAKKKNKNLPPGPPRLPIIGNLHQLGVIPHYSLWQLSKKYGSVMLLQLGYVPTVIISSAEAAKELLKTNDLNSCSRPLLTTTGRFSYNHHDISFAPYGDYWREMRKICVLELFSAKRVQSFQFIREEEVGFLIDSISKSSSSSSSSSSLVNLSEKTLPLTANIICRLAFGKSFQDRGFNHERFQGVIHEVVAILGSFFAADYFPYVGWIGDMLTGLHARTEKTFQEFDVFYQKIIDDHILKERKEHGHEDVIDILLELERYQTDNCAFQFSQDSIKAILMDIFLAGVDTGAVTLVWVMAELAKNPRVMRKAQEEIRTCIGDKTRVYESDINKLHYLKMVLNETLRLHPPATLLLPREAMSEFSIKDYKIYPKTRIHVNVWAIGRDPESWRDPEEFFPERFIDNPIDYKGQNYEFLPFGGGRRGCLAIAMGIANIELALANLLFCFDWKLPCNMKEEDMDMEESYGLVSHKKVPLVLEAIKYQPSKFVLNK